ncbi:MAG TPA: DUF3147 family protein [Burkholderiaceae bacterium]|nr:DUF3147 family protein [Burkholderiaceae bacterium]
MSLPLIVKYLVTAALVVLVSELARRSDRAGALVAALPLVSVLTLVWLHVEAQPAEKLANHAWFTFWYVLPTLPMFLFFPPLLSRLGFWPTLGVCAGATAGCFWLIVGALRRCGVELLP